MKGWTPPSPRSCHVFILRGRTPESALAKVSTLQHREAQRHVGFGLWFVFDSTNPPLLDSWEMTVLMSQTLPALDDPAQGLWYGVVEKNSEIWFFLPVSTTGSQITWSRLTSPGLFPRALSFLLLSLPLTPSPSFSFILVFEIGAPQLAAWSRMGLNPWSLSCPKCWGHRHPHHA